MKVRHFSVKIHPLMKLEVHLGLKVFTFHNYKTSNPKIMELKHNFLRKIG